MTYLYQQHIYTVSLWQLQCPKP